MQAYFLTLQKQWCIGINHTFSMEIDASEVINNFFKYITNFISEAISPVFLVTLQMPYSAQLCLRVTVCITSCSECCFSLLPCRKGNTLPSDKKACCCFYSDKATFLRFMKLSILQIQNGVVFSLAISLMRLFSVFSHSLQCQFVNYRTHRLLRFLSV